MPSVPAEVWALAEGSITYAIGVSGIHDQTRARISPRRWRCSDLNQGRLDPVAWNARWGGDLLDLIGRRQPKRSERRASPYLKTAHRQRSGKINSLWLPSLILSRIANAGSESGTL